MVFSELAEHCRRQANEFAGRPEAPFLLRVASAFDELAIGEGVSHLHAKQPHAGATLSA